jgi:hypothetical protein
MGGPVRITGSAGQTMVVEPPDTDNEVNFGLCSFDVELYGWVGLEDRKKLIRWLVECTPGWDE